MDDLLEYRKSLQRFSPEPVVYQELSVESSWEQSTKLMEETCKKKKKKKLDSKSLYVEDKFADDSYEYEETYQDEEESESMSELAGQHAI